MRAALIALLLARVLAAQCVLGPWTATANFSADIVGYIDTRPLTEELPRGAAGRAPKEITWGTTGVVRKATTFRPPPGYRVRILSIEGDFIVWPTAIDPTGRGVMPAAPAPGRYVGTLAAIQTAEHSQGSVRADWIADDALAYVQGFFPGAARQRIAVRDLGWVENSLLGPDHKLWVVMASWLNDTGFAAHMEVTLSSIKYRFEKENGCYR